MNARIRQAMMAAGTMAILFGSVSCGNVARTGRSPMMLVVVLLTAAPTGVPVLSDVQRMVGTPPVATVDSDLAVVTFRAILKDPNPPTLPATPSPLNAITLSRYHVEFVRTDGRKTPGIDVPYAFDGAITAVVAGSDTTPETFELVRAQAKLEAPLRALVNQGGLVEISTIAYVTFYGQDQTGNDVQVTATIGVTFADFPG
jgi:hypothetical protein